MERAEAVSLLQEIMSNCESFHLAQVVSVSRNMEAQGWALKAKWICPDSEKECLNRIILMYGVKVSEIDGYTVFC